MQRCRFKPGSVAFKPGRNRVQSVCTYTGPVPSLVSEKLWGVISAMNPGPITGLIKNDQVIIDVGQHLLNKGGISDKNQQCVQQKMRNVDMTVKQTSF